MKLAIANILHDRIRFLVAVAGIGFATLLMLFQGSILSGFLKASSRLIDLTDAELWITDRGVSCFDFSSRLRNRYRFIAEGVTGVRNTSRICVSSAEYRKPDGAPQTVILVGADTDAGSNFPIPRRYGTPNFADPDTVLIDQTNVVLLKAGTIPTDAEVNRKRVLISGYVQGFGSFLGSPYVFANYSDAAEHIHLGPDETMYVLVKALPGYPASTLQRELQARMPEVRVWTKGEFAAQSRQYWLSQTGAGNTILLSAVLGFLIGLLVVSQTMHATTMENIEEFATLKAMGASSGFVVRIVLMQAIICGLAGTVSGMIAALPLIAMAQRGISWLNTPPWLPMATGVFSLLMCCVAAFSAVRTALDVEPGRVFRV